MPTYQYACTKPECGEKFELVQSFTDPSASECPVCGGPVRKVYSAVGVVFKGSGFYRNDSRAKSGTGESNSSSAKESAGKESSTGSSGKDSASKDSSTPTTAKESSSSSGKESSSSASASSSGSSSSTPSGGSSSKAAASSS